jgi:hypothetical protein
LARNTILAFLLFWTVWWAGPGRRRDWTTVPGLGWVRWLPVAASVFVLVAFTVLAAWYLAQDGFASEVEPVVSSLSWQVQSGQALYTSFAQAERYSVLYGPSVFLTNGFFLQVLGPSFTSVKMASALASVGSLLFLYAALARKRRDLVALAATAGAALFFWAQGFSIYSVRPDALIVFAVALGLYAATRTTRWLAIVTVAVLAGFTVNLKIHCLLYFLPVIVVLAQRLGWRAAAWALAGAAVVVVAPFLLYPQISVVNYLEWLANETGHGLHLDLLVLPIGYAALLGLPLALVAWFRGRRHGFLGTERLVVLSLALALGVCFVLSAKQGSGIVHLMPLVPSVMFVVGRLVRPLLAGGSEFWAGRTTRSAAVAVVLTVLLAGVVTEYRAARLVAWQLAQSPGLVQDIKGIMESYDGLPMAMGFGGVDRWYRTTWYQPMLTFQDNPVLVDPVSVMDTLKSGRNLAAATYDALAAGKVALWLVPRSQVPFQLRSLYDPAEPMFPQEFVEKFRDCYSLRGQSRYFDLWFWNGLDALPDAPLAASGPSEAVNLAR